MKPTRIYKNYDENLYHRLMFSCNKIEDKNLPFKEEKFPELLPFAYMVYNTIQLVYIWIFNSDGTIFKNGFIHPNDLFYVDKGELETYSIEKILKSNLYKTIHQYYVNKGLI